MAGGMLEALDRVRAENAFLRSQGLEPKGFGALIEGGSQGGLLETLGIIGGGDNQGLQDRPQQNIEQALVEQLDPRSVDPLGVGVSGRASGQTGAQSLQFGTPPPDLFPVTPRSKESREQATRSLVRLQTLDPTGTSFKFAMSLIANRKAEDLAATKLKMDEVFKETSNLLRIKDPAALERAIVQTIRDRTARGIASPALERILAMPMERRVVGLEQRKVIATDVKTLSTNEQKELDRESKERLAALSRAPGSIFGNIDPSKFTPASLAKVQKTGNFGDLDPVLKGPNATIMAAVLPFFLGDLDLDDPQAFAQALAKAEFITQTASGAPTEKLAALKKFIAIQNKKPKPVQKAEEPGFLDKVMNFLSNLFAEGTPEQESIEQTLKGKAATDFAVMPRTDIQKAFPRALTDDEGFFYIPDNRAPSGRRFLRDKPGKDGNKIKAQ